ncbi:hypothetical protein [Hymenobacter sp. PAMC 26628]|uniref:hypothetical protein n=1 Tax=Hymenobacter sp. PAMC 26628 TaxID=1484118 RepID=UPI0007706A59|nr:hypothetical protein [Hymenobacter sp. PAMC 26628]AMJ65361.1 hypothetical protein AXW84_07885 [Hymenobacter sp. PAMC 26628]
MIARFISCTCFVAVCIVWAGPARAQAQPAAPVASAASAGAPANVTLTGRIDTPKGPLGGAVVRLVRTKQTCATNADGLFFFIVPADAGPVAAVAAYDGAAEVPFTMQPGGPLTVVNMAPAKLTRANQKQLNARIKRAHRETKRSLKQLK